MAPLPDVTVTLGNGNLGRVAPSEDGISALIVSGVAVGGSFGLGDVLGPWFSVQDAIDAGIDEAYDTTNSVLAYRHIADFYEQAGNGTELYVAVAPLTKTLSELVDVTEAYAAKVLSDLQGRVRLLGVTRVPDGAYTPSYTDEFDDDLATAITNAKALRAAEFALHRPVQIVLEGSDFQGSASAARDLRSSATGPSANRVSVVIGQDNAVATAAGGVRAKYAAVGMALGRMAAIPVQRNIGRVKDGALPITTGGLSNGAALDTFTDANLDSLHDKGYIIVRRHAGIPGVYFNDDPTAAPITDDYASVARGRTMDKAARITRQIYLQELNDDVELDPSTGRLAISVIKSYQGSIETEVDRQMTANGEISGVTAFVNPAQNVLSTDQIDTELNIVPKGQAKAITATLQYENPAA